MERVLAAFLTVDAYILLPVVVGLAIAGLLWLRERRAHRKASIRELVCSIDADCPPGFTCIGGLCVPATEG
jgi:hypothetical protein